MARVDGVGGRVNRLRDDFGIGREAEQGRHEVLGYRNVSISLLQSK
jgi:hypothetical protein